MKKLNDLIKERKDIYDNYLKSINKFTKGDTEKDKKAKAKKAMKELADLKFIDRAFEGKDDQFLIDELFRAMYDLKVCNDRLKYIRGLRKSGKIAEALKIELVADIKREAQFTRRNRQKKGLLLILEENELKEINKRIKKEYIKPDFEKDYLSRQMELQW